MAERPRSRVCGVSLAGVAGSNPAGGINAGPWRSTQLPIKWVIRKGNAAGA